MYLRALLRQHSKMTNELETALKDFLEAIKNAHFTIESVADRLEPSKGDLKTIKGLASEVRTVNDNLVLLLFKHEDTREEWDELIHSQFSVWGPPVPSFNAVIGRMEFPERYKDHHIDLNAAWDALDIAITDTLNWCADMPVKIAAALEG